MMIFHRRHYDKALLVALSTLKYWHENTHPMHLVIQQFWQHLMSTQWKIFTQCFEQEPRRQTRQNRYVRKPKRSMPARKICKNFNRHLSPPGSSTSAGSALTISKKGLQNFWSKSLRPSTPTLVWHPNNPGSNDSQNMSPNGIYQICLELK